MAYFFCCLFSLWDWILRTRTLKCVLVLCKIALWSTWSILSFLFRILLFCLKLRFDSFNVLVPEIFISCGWHDWLLELSLFNRTICKGQLFCWFRIWNYRRCVSIWVAHFTCLTHLYLILLQLLNIRELALLHLL